MRPCQKRIAEAFPVPLSHQQVSTCHVLQSLESFFRQFRSSRNIVEARGFGPWSVARSPTNYVHRLRDQFRAPPRKSADSTVLRRRLAVMRPSRNLPRKRRHRHSRQTADSRSRLFHEIARISNCYRGRGRKRLRQLPRRLDSFPMRACLRPRQKATKHMPHRPRSPRAQAATTYRILPVLPNVDHGMQIEPSSFVC